ncbi:MAG: hypothetical protein ABJF23_24950, partial [Bryobacteraceae bacterium]
MRRLRMIFTKPIIAVLALATALAQPRDPGVIAFTHAPDGGPPWPVNDVFTMADDGSKVRALTRDGHSHSPTWSPDGRRILFISDSNHRPVELHVMNADGGNRHLLRRLEPVIYAAAWSPDGATIAVTCLLEAGDPMRAGLFLMPSNGTGTPQRLVRNAFTPAWSPDGKRIAYSLESPRGEWAIHVSDVDGTHDLELTDRSRIAGSPAWSPDGTQIAFDELGGTQISVMAADGSRKRRITADPNWSCGHPSWSPDGKQIVYSCRSASSPCGTVSSVGTVLPECARRIFAISSTNPKAVPVQLGERDGAAPAFA